MIKNILLLTIVMLFAGLVGVKAQTAPDYKISAIKILPFDSQTGEFQDEFKMKDERVFFNELGISLFVKIEISGKAGSFTAARNLQVTVTEGKKIKAKKTEQIGIISEGEKFYVPVWLDSSMCSTITITAKIIGQKTPSTLTRTVPFQCGE